MWLNNCIGSDNYDDFYLLIWLFVFWMVEYVVIAVFAMIERSLMQKTGLLVLASIYLFFSLLTIAYGSELISLHRWL
jgi:hypothetical protein